jgi:hypothetical protein
MKKVQMQDWVWLALEINAGNHYRAYKILNETQLTSPEGQNQRLRQKIPFLFRRNSITGFGL